MPTAQATPKLQCATCEYSHLLACACMCNHCCHCRPSTAGRISPHHEVLAQQYGVHKALVCLCVTVGFSSNKTTYVNMFCQAATLHAYMSDTEAADKQPHWAKHLHVAESKKWVSNSANTHTLFTGMCNKLSLDSSSGARCTTHHNNKTKPTRVTGLGC
jgi:hypothetical protein